MGMSASQARLLFISSRKNDIELKSQQIANQKIRLASESEQVSTDYANAMNKTKLVARAFVDNQFTDVDLSYNSIMSPEGVLSGKYTITNANGKPVVSQEIANAFDGANGNVNNFLNNMGVPIPSLPAGSFVMGEGQSVNTELLHQDAVAASNTFKNSTSALTEFGIDNPKKQRNAEIVSWAQNVVTQINAMQTGNITKNKAKEATIRSAASLCTSMDNSGGLPTDNNLKSIKGYHTYLNGDQGLMANLNKSKISVSQNVYNTMTNSGFDPDNPYTGGGVNHFPSQIEQPVAQAAQVVERSYSLGDDPSVILDQQNQQQGLLYAPSPKSGGNLPRVEMAEALTAQPEQLAMQSLDFGAPAEPVGEGSGYQTELAMANHEILAGFQAIESIPAIRYIHQVDPVIINPDTPPSNTYQVTWKDYRDYSGDNARGSSASLPGTVASLSNFQSSWNGSSYITAWENAHSGDAAYQQNFSDIPVGFAEGADTSNLTPEQKYYMDLYFSMLGAGGYEAYDPQALNNNDMLQAMLDNGMWSLNKNGEQKSISELTDIQEVADKDGFAKAEAEYNAKTAKINKKEKKLDMELKKLDTEHSALQTEEDSVKNLIKDNTDKTFNLFS